MERLSLPPFQLEGGCPSGVATPTRRTTDRAVHPRPFRAATGPHWFPHQPCRTEGATLKASWPPAQCRKLTTSEGAGASLHSSGFTASSEH